MIKIHILRFIKGSRLIICSLFLVPTLSAQQFTFPERPNPHGGDDCSACHSTNGKPSKTNFQIASCSTCHSADAVNSHIHPLYHLNPASEIISMPENFKLDASGNASCLTCHEIRCKVDRANRTFLRDGPYSQELDFCYKCHDRELYARTNPHNQLLEDGSIDSDVCLYCHLKKPTPEDHPLISRQMHLGINETCNKCHALHRHENEHQGVNVVTSKKTSLRHIKRSEKRLNIKLPLSENNEIQCNTCHYIHGSFGIDQVHYGSSGENEHYLRVPNEKLCYACHEL
ncbi:MAG: hypothetical protein K9N35_00110 [Candidatus Marinimicrobia bacterium]|nr:hypothetical protein [Candidatus Neomarinimicrobiota bacterium]